MNTPYRGSFTLFPPDDSDLMHVSIHLAGQVEWRAQVDPDSGECIVSIDRDSRTVMLSGDAGDLCRMFKAIATAISDCANEIMDQQSAEATPMGSAQ